MTTVSIVPGSSSENAIGYRAIAGQLQSVGKTPGEALDSISSQLDDEDAATLVIVQKMQPDRFFTAAQQQRLAELMERWRTARDTQTPFPPNEQAELQELVEAELKAAAERAKALIQQLQS